MAATTTTRDPGTDARTRFKRWCSDWWFVLTHDCEVAGLDRVELAAPYKAIVSMIGNHYLIQFFAYKHLPEHLQAISRPFGELAEALDGMLPENPEKTTALRKLLAAKDCAVRAVLFKGA